MYAHAHTWAHYSIFARSCTTFGGKCRVRLDTYVHAVSVPLQELREMMGRPKPEDARHCSKAKGERSKKAPKSIDGKDKSGKKNEAVSTSTSAGGGVRGQSQSCHQCRQSIHSSKGVSEVKSGRERLKCSKCTRYW